MSSNKMELSSIDPKILKFSLELHEEDDGVEGWIQGMGITSIPTEFPFNKVGLKRVFRELFFHMPDCLVLRAIKDSPWMEFILEDD